MRVHLLEEAKAGKVLLILMLGGYRTGKKAVDLVSEPREIAYAAIDYPYNCSFSPESFSDKAAMLFDIRHAFVNMPPALMLAMDWLERQPWFDAGRTNLIGVSLGVPFAAVAGAADDRFRRVWLIS